MRKPIRMLGLTMIVLSVLSSSQAFAADGNGREAIADSNAAFGFDLYQELKKTEGNLFFSPHSISMALAMTYAGARGQTEKEMAGVLHFSLDQTALHPAFSDLQSLLDSIQNEGEVRLSVANSLWGQQNDSFLETFLNVTQSHYGAGLRFVDFVKDTEAARQTINSWVEEETEQKIQDLIKQGVLDTSASLVLCNAIYFKGNWAHRFNKKTTRDADFFVAPTKAVKVAMMTQASKFRWKVLEDLSIVELPYEGDDLSMVILLPKATDGLAEVEKRLTEENISKWMYELRQSRASKVTVGLPRFRTTCDFELSRVLASMGMPSAFGGDPDFSGMTGTRELFISNVVHKAFIEVNEEGTEAAAATGVLAEMSAPSVFRADHPFIFLIQEKQTGSILFLGRIVDPTK